MRRLWVWVILLDIAALALLKQGLVGLHLSDLAWGLLIAAINAWAELSPLNLNEDGDLTVSAVVQLASLLVLGLRPTLVGVLVGELAFSLMQKRPLIKTLFNMAQTVVSVALAHWVLLLVGGVDGSLTIHAVPMALIYVLTNTTLVAWILSLVQQQSFWRVFLHLNQDTLAYSIILSISGLAFGGLMLTYSWLGLAMTGILLLCLRAVLAQAGYNLRAMKSRFMHTIKVITTALEYRDPYTYGHTSRVATWCRKIALEMELPPGEVDLIELGGTLHDVGKVGVPDAILNKPGALSPEEYEKIKEHPLIGERIILGMQDMEQVDRLAAMARQHHLYFDRSSRSYPEAPADEQLYIGSRILSVADAWDAMTADRPYRRALSRDEAIARLQACKGTQFDPAVVDLFLQVLEREGREMHAQAADD